jgi:hypothetical protein
MKVKHYNEMMAYLTRPGFNSGGSVNFNGGGSVRNKPVLPKRKPPEEVKKRKKINYEKIKRYLGKESQELIEKELGFAIGGSVETPKRGLVDEPGSYRGEAGGEATRLKNLEQRSQIDGWLKVWLDNNFKNYEVRDKDKFLKDLKKDWKKAQKTEFKNNRLAQAGDLPSPTARFRGAGSGKDKQTVPNKKFFSMFDEALLQSSELEKDRFYRRLFYAGQIDVNPELKKDINNYFKTVLIDKSRTAGFTQSKIDELNKFLGKNSDVAFILGTDTGLENQMKQKIFGNRFKNYSAYRDKVAQTSLKYMENVKKLEKITGIPIRKEMGKEQRALKKILNVDGLPLELRYSMDHLYGISEAVRNPKDKVFAKQVAENLIGGTQRQNAAAGLGGYSVKRKALINNINQGKNVTKSLARLNELTTEAYPQFKNLKQPYKIVDGQLTFAKGFKGETQPERFKSYFQQLNKTPQGRKLIQDQVGGIRNLIKTVDQLPSGAQGKICNALKAGGLSTTCAEAIRQDPIKTASIVEQETARLPTNVGGKALQAARFVKNVAGPAAIAGEVGFEGLMIADKALKTGMPLKQAFGESILNLALGPKLRVDLEAERAKEFAKGEDFAMAERGRRKAPFLAQGEYADRLRREARVAEMQQKFPGVSEDVLKKELLKQDPKIDLSLFPIQDLKQLVDDQAKLDFFAENFRQEKAGGGIMKMAGKSSGPAPESGPTPDGPSEGLASLLKNGMKIKE